MRRRVLQFEMRAFSASRRGEVLPLDAGNFERTFPIVVHDRVDARDFTISLGSYELSPAIAFPLELIGDGQAAGGIPALRATRSAQRLDSEAGRELPRRWPFSYRPTGPPGTCWLTARRSTSAAPLASLRPMIFSGPRLLPQTGHPGFVSAKSSSIPSYVPLCFKPRGH